MTILGDSSNPSFGNIQSSQYNQASPDSNSLTTPSTMIQVTKLWAFVGGNGGTVAGAKLCVWGTGGTLIYSSQTLTLPSGRQWVSVVPSTTLLLAPATGCFVGWWAPVGSALDWGVRSSGHWQGRKNVNPVGNMTGATVDDLLAGEAGGYLEYQPASVYQGPSGGGAPVSVQGIYQGPNGGGSPVQVLGVYQGPAGGGTPVRIW